MRKKVPLNVSVSLNPETVCIRLFQRNRASRIN